MLPAGETTSLASLADDLAKHILRSLDRFSMNDGDYDMWLDASIDPRRNSTHRIRVNICFVFKSGGYVLEKPLSLNLA